MMKLQIEKFKQTLGNYEILKDREMSEAEENFIEVANRVASIAYDINDMTRFMSNTMDKDINMTDEDWKAFTSKLHKIEYLLDDCRDRYNDVIVDIDLKWETVIYMLKKLAFNAFALSLLCELFIANPTTTEPHPNYGDVNLDGVVTIADVVTLNKWISNHNIVNLSVEALFNADCYNPTNDINDVDISLADSETIIHHVIFNTKLPIIFN